ncbi:MAG: extracellular solute-binding protein [Planctomycetes bacterium]|nr:extracellular solute-binding protein [Planctomycetota bacterium]
MSIRNVLSRPTFPVLALWSLALIIVVAGGCKRDHGESDSPNAAPPELPLRVLVIDDEPLAKAVKLAWDSRVGGDTKVITLTAAELLEGERKRLNADVVLYPSYLLGELAEREWIEPIDSEDASDPLFDRQGIFELIRLHEINWGNTVYAVPLGSPQFTVLYRKDIFTKLQLEPPATWDEYQVLVNRLSDRSTIGDLAAPSDEEWSGVAEPLAPTWAGTMLLARAAAYARHRNQYSTLFDFNSMEPLIASPPFERALQELVTSAANDRNTQHTPKSACRAFLAGECAMAITWPSQAGNDSSVPSPLTLSERDNWIGVCELPGSTEVYNSRTKSWGERGTDESARVSLIAIDGRLGSVTKNSHRKKQALGMLFMISGDELGTTIGSSSSHTTLFRATQLGQESTWVDRELAGDAAREYGEVVQAAQNRASWLDAIRIPGRDKYLAALDRAVESVASNEATPADALSAAASKWNDITDSIGRASQQRAYMRSLGLEP